MVVLLHTITTQQEDGVTDRKFNRVGKRGPHEPNYTDRKFNRVGKRGPHEPNYDPTNRPAPFTK